MKKKVILVTSNALGKGNDKLGEILLENFFTLLKKSFDQPQAIFFVNNGVLALTNQSLTSLQLQDLEFEGVEILGCKTCIEQYGIGDQLTVGKVSSMARFIELAEDYEVMTL